jgi:hypothetical protein
MSTKLKALILTPMAGGLALLVWAAFATALTGTDSGTTLMKSLVPIMIGVATLITMIVEAIAM